MEKCIWRQEDFEGGQWPSECGLNWYLDDGTPKENEMNYCPKCGKELDEKIYVEDEDDE